MEGEAVNEILAGQIRHALTSVGTVLATTGVLSDGTIQTGIGIIMAVLPFVWSFVAKRK